MSFVEMFVGSVFCEVIREVGLIFLSLSLSLSPISFYHFCIVINISFSLSSLFSSFKPWFLIEQQQNLSIELIRNHSNQTMHNSFSSPILYLQQFPNLNLLIKWDNNPKRQGEINLFELCTILFKFHFFQVQLYFANLFFKTQKTNENNSPIFLVGTPIENSQLCHGVCNSYTLQTNLVTSSINFLTSPRFHILWICLPLQNFALHN